jgi:hypothetical protein
VAWVRKYWPIPVAAAYLLCQFLIWLTMWRYGAAPATLWYDNGGTKHLGPVLFFAIFLGVRWAPTGRRLAIGIALALVAILVQGGIVYYQLDLASSASYLATMRLDSDPRIAKLPAHAMEIKNGKGGRNAARFYFRETGVSIPYRDDSGEVRMFEPTAKDAASQKNWREWNEKQENDRPTLQARATKYRWQAYSNLFLGCAALLGAIALPWWRRARRSRDEQAPPPPMANGDS